MSTPDAYWFFANLAVVRVRGAATKGRLAVVEIHGAPGDSPPLHLHRNEDEVFVVTEGRMTICQPSRRVEVPAGSIVLAERGVPHTFRVADEGPARWLLLAFPAGFEAFVAELGEPARALAVPDAPVVPDPEKLAALAAKYGIEFC